MADDDETGRLPPQIREEVALVLEPRRVRRLQVEVEPRTPLLGAETVIGPFERDAQAADGGAPLLAASKVPLGQRAHHTRCGVGDVEWDTLVLHEALEPCQKAATRAPAFGPAGAAAAAVIIEATGSHLPDGRCAADDDDVVAVIAMSGPSTWRFGGPRWVSYHWRGWHASLSVCMATHGRAAAVCKQQTTEWRWLSPRARDVGEGRLPGHLVAQPVVPKGGARDEKKRGVRQEVLERKQKDEPSPIVSPAV